MIPLFKTHYSVGKSLLTPERCFELAAGFKEIVFVEDSMAGFRKINKLSQKKNIPVRFGLRVPFPEGKVIIFARNNKGVEELKEFSTEFSLGNLYFPESKNFMIVAPFYDSYLHYNIHNFGINEMKCHSYFYEDNSHPFDFQILERISIFNPIKVKSIYYENERDFKEYQCIRAIALRKNKSPTYDNPNIDNCGSDKFSFESWKYQR